jgi:BMFP domain-containing protein YqiC
MFHSRLRSTVWRPDAGKPLTSVTLGPRPRRSVAKTAPCGHNSPHRPDWPGLRGGGVGYGCRRCQNYDNLSASERSIELAFDPKSLEELARKLADAVPPGIAALRDDLERNFRAVLQSGLARLDLVTRQEFDIQSAVLRRSRERLEELEKRIAALEKDPGKQ